MRWNVTLTMVAVSGWLLSSCQGENCETHAATSCSEGVSYWTNSCGDLEEVYQHCLIGCNVDHTDCEEPECLTDAECNDDDLCTDDSCSEYACVFTDVGADCDDDIACTDDSCAPESGCVFEPNQAACDDDDGCTTDVCDATLGCTYSYACDPDAACLEKTCVCNDGYRGTGLVCTDIDECAEETNACSSRASCTNLPGSYDCACNPPYIGDGFVCTLCGDGMCEEGETLNSCPGDCDLDLVLIVESSLSAGLTASLDQYLDDLRQAGRNARVTVWNEGSVRDLKDLLISQVADYDIEGAFLLGDLPAAWYECDCWQGTPYPMHEEYPCDIYLMDLDASWYDSDWDEMFDSHTNLSADIFVSRLIGNVNEIRDYLGKLHDYRTSGPLLPQSAFIFIDDDWSAWPGNYGLDAIYASVDLLSDTSQTTRNNYLDRLEGAGNEFVYQWIHADPHTLYIMHNYDYQSVYLYEVTGDNHRASFLNLFNCSAARFTEWGGCLSQGYLTGTDYGLADIGSTKAGGIYEPEVFHSRLAAGDTWGEAFRQWYNQTGNYDDEWHLGVVISGDPLLTISNTTRKAIGDWPSRKWTDAQRAELTRTMVEFARRTEVGSFQDYRAQNPQFFIE